MHTSFRLAINIARRIESQLPIYIVGFLLFCFSVNVSAADTPRLHLDAYNPSCNIDVSQHDALVQVTWPIGDKKRARIEFDLTPDQPLIHSLAVAADSKSSFQQIAAGLDPTLMLRVGQRNLDLRGGWTIFFDRMQQKPHKVVHAQFGKTTATATSRAKRATLTISEVSAGPFSGELRWTFYAGSPLVLQEAVVSTDEDRVAMLYDTGLVCRQTKPRELAWRDPLGEFKTERAESIEAARNVAVGGRAVCAEFQRGSLAVFPLPHRYFYPLDFSDNLKNIWVGPKYAGEDQPFGFGIRHDPKGDNRFVPWFNAPPGTAQELGMFLLVSNDSAKQTLVEVARFTRSDKFARLPGHVTFSSHYHVEHTREMLEAQPAKRQADGESKGQLPSGGEYGIPRRLERPGFVRVFRDKGIDIVHLAEFHFGRTPRMNQRERLEHLELLHAECRRLSDEKFLLLPGEEPNVHLGGHWISFFPRPVYWVLHRRGGTPFVSEHPQLGKVYHVGSEADVLRLLNAEGGLAWTAHPRIKSSTGFPDGYRDRLFFSSDRFLGAAWKAMPADLSQPRLGRRVLDLFDDMANWGATKYVLGEVDVFKIEPDHELYGHMNVNYLRLDSIPRFEDGWQPILDALRGGKFFVTTGEVLIPEFTVNGRKSGELLTLPEDGQAQVRLDLQWTFPLAYAEIISGDGEEVKRQRVDLSSSESCGTETFTVDVDLTGQRWVRVEVWDVATNGAFTQPVWIAN